MKTACVTPIFKSGYEYLLTNYRPISVLPCFSEILGCIMYNRVYGFLRENNILYEKHFGFQAVHSTEYAILQLSNLISNRFTLGGFVDFSKAFDTVDYKIQIKKLGK